MKIAVIGLGAGAIGFIDKIMKDPNVQLTVFEKSKNEMDSSLSGIRSDGKLLVSEDAGSDIHIPLETQFKARDIYTNGLYMAEKLTSGLRQQPTFGDHKVYKSFENVEQYNKFYNNGFKPIKSEYIHLGTDQLKIIIPYIVRTIKSTYGDRIDFKFDCDVKEIQSAHGKYNLIMNDNTFPDPVGIEPDGIEVGFDKVVIAVGRSGYKFIKSVLAWQPDFIQKDSKQVVDIGVRFECPDFIVKDLNEKNYEWKVNYLTRTGYYGRTFCNNPSGQVTIENYKDIKTVNGHSFHDEKSKSKNTNFAILISSSFTHPFKDPNEYGEYIAKLGNKLAGDKVMLQTVGDFLNFKRTKHIGRVIPTLGADKYELSDMNLAFPAKIREALADFLINIGKVESGLLQPDNLMYGIEVKFYSNKTVNKDNVYFVGDCSGHTRSICHATAHGIMCAEEILKC